MILNVFIGLSLTVGVLAMLEVLLGEQQKKHIFDRVAAAWLALYTQKDWCLSFGSTLLGDAYEKPEWLPKNGQLYSAREFLKLLTLFIVCFAVWGPMIWYFRVSASFIASDTAYWLWPILILSWIIALGIFVVGISVSSVLFYVMFFLSGCGVAQCS
jgi:hypothetical protein